MLFAHCTLSVMIGVMLLSSGGCGVHAPESNATAPMGDTPSVVTHAIPSSETAPVSLETFAALLDRA